MTKAASKEFREFHNLKNMVSKDQTLNLKIGLQEDKRFPVIIIYWCGFAGRI